MLAVRGGGITVRVDVADGARLTSLTSGGREWLAPSGPRSPGVFVQPGSGGWDEVVPTVAACVLGDGAALTGTAFAGTQLADHGDAWQSSWTLVSESATHVEASVRLTSLPITLARRIDASDAGIRLSYTATTDSERPVPLFWCAHPLFSAHPGTRIRVAGKGDRPGHGLTEPRAAPLVRGSGSFRTCVLRPGRR